MLESEYMQIRKKPGTWGRRGELAGILLISLLISSISSNSSWQTGRAKERSWGNDTARVHSVSTTTNVHQNLHIAHDEQASFRIRLAAMKQKSEYAARSPAGANRATFHRCMHLIIHF